MKLVPIASQSKRCNIPAGGSKESLKTNIHINGQTCRPVSTRVRFCLMQQSILCKSSIDTNLFKASTSFTAGCVGFLLANKWRKLTTCRVESKWAEPSERLPGVWEVPDDCSGSDYDEEIEELEEYDMDYESDWEDETYAKATTRIVGNSTSKNYEEDGRKTHMLHLLL
ncbi:conserved hypothetical protein [Ricinus communis]|uniref:Uncharacterized protein n=1 Tax=Ricinus communis TaxID=3988 RepID=B9RUD9_RICCO|nr:conserved hypothetical protein [Ricinus communis]